MFMGQGVVQLVEALGHKTGGPGLSCRWGPLKFSGNLILLSAFISPGVHTPTNRKEYLRISLAVKSV